MSEVGPESAVAASRTVEGLGGRLHVRDHPGQEPAFVMMHGFPDDSRIYGRLAPLLAPSRVVAVDWLGYGRSERSEPAPFHDEQHRHQLRAVLDSLKLGRVALVGHDASGPDAIGYALADPGRVAHLILLNTYYGHALALCLPEMIRLFADPNFAPPGSAAALAAVLRKAQRHAGASHEAIGRSAGVAESAGAGNPEDRQLGPAQAQPHPTADSQPIAIPAP